MSNRTPNKEVLGNEADTVSALNKGRSGSPGARPTDDPRWTEFFEYLTSTAAGGGKRRRALSPGTAGTYVKAAKRAMTHGGADYLDRCHSASTRIVVYTALGHWADFTQDTALREQVSQAAFSGKLTGPRGRMVLPIPSDQYDALVASLEALRSSPGWAWPVLSILFKLGLRVSEVLGLERALCLEALSTGRLSLKGKGGAYRTVPSALVEEELRVLTSQSGWATIEGLVAPRRTSEVQRVAGGGYKAVWRALRALAVQAGVPEVSVHPHRLRHTIAARLLDATGKMHLVQQLLGHRDIRTTQIYTHADRSDEINEGLMRAMKSTV